jgi:pimeloyl-ACP methyl ester carboxylesterase
LILLHTIRTQLDIYQKIIPELSKHFKVYALDYPGHGYSDIPEIEYSPELFIDAVDGFLDKLDIQHATVAGISIGGTISLVLAARNNPRIVRAIAINPYDYDKGRGVYRSSIFAKLLFSMNWIPIIGATNWRLRNYFVFKTIMEGGVTFPRAFPEGLIQAMDNVGNRPYHYRAFMSLISHLNKWEDLRNEYANINKPVLLLYGERDWSNDEERNANLRDISSVRTEIIQSAGHFLSLDAPEQLMKQIINFAKDYSEQQDNKASLP